MLQFKTINDIIYFGGVNRMEITEFNKQIKEKSFQNIYFFCGEEEYLKEYYIKRLVSAVIPKGMEPFNYFVYKENPEIKDVISSIEQTPVMNEYKVVYLDNVDIFKKDANFRDGLLSCIEDIPPYTILVIKEEKADEKTKLGKAIKKNGAVIVCSYPSLSEMKTFIAREFGKSGKKISSANAEKIITECEKDMHTVINLINAVSAYMNDKTEVTSEILSLFIIKSTDSAIYDLTDSVISGNSKKALEILKGLLMFPKNTPQSLFTSITNHISSMYIISLCEKAGVSSSETLTYLSGKFPPFLINKYKAQLKRIPFDKLEKLLSFCAETDYKLKSGLIRDTLMPLYEITAYLSEV